MLISKFKGFSIEQLARIRNLNVDALASLRSSISSEFRRTILIEIIAYSSILESKESCYIEVIKVMKQT